MIRNAQKKEMTVMMSLAKRFIIVFFVIWRSLAAAIVAGIAFGFTLSIVAKYFSGAGVVVVIVTMIAACFALIEVIERGH